MKGKISKRISKRILAILCVVSVTLTSISFSFASKAEGETVTKFEDTDYATWTKVTFDSYGWEDGAYSPGDISVKYQYGQSLEGKVFSGHVTFSDKYVALYSCGATSGIWSGMYLQSGDGDNLTLGIGGATHTLDPDIAGVDLVNNPFNLKFSYEVLDADSDGTKDTLKLGVWIEDALYNNEYFQVTTDGDGGTYATYLTGGLAINGSGTLAIKSDKPETLDSTLKEISFDAFGWEDGTFNYMGDISTKYGHTDSLAGKVFSGDVKFSENFAGIYIGGGDLGIWKGLSISSGVGADTLQMGFGGKTHTFTSDIAGTKLTEKSFNLKISYQLEDNNMDGTNDTLRLGVWFNNVLYNNKYIRLSGESNYNHYLTGGLGIFAQACAGGSGELTIASLMPGVIGQYITETNTGDMNRVPYNNDEITADLGVGAASYVVVADMNHDGYMDLFVGSHAKPFGGTHVFYGSADSQNSDSANYLLMDKGRQIAENGNTVTATYLYDEEGKYDKTVLHFAYDASAGAQTAKLPDASKYPDVSEALAMRLYCKLPAEIEGEAANQYNPFSQTMADFDGDGVMDMITSWGCWSEYSSVGSNVSGYKYDNNGIWGDDNGDGIGDDDGDGDDDPLHGWVVWSKNNGTGIGPSEASYDDSCEVVTVWEHTVNEDGTKSIVESTEHALDVYGTPFPQLADWDHDGDLDIICSNFISEITYFENIAIQDGKTVYNEPTYIEGRKIPLGVKSGDTYVAGDDVFEFELAMPAITAFDWNNDGWMDIICGEEDGRVCIAEHTGQLDENGTPIMKNYRYFQTPADNLKSGVLNTPVSVDWDGDGDEDIICGNSAGFIDFIKNLSIEKNHPLSDPVWDNPVHLTNPDGEVYRIMAGYNGSYQGPSEAKWGYTQVSVADWDGDGTLDIMSNNIVGQVYIHKGIEGKPYMIEEPQKIEVEWENGNIYPEWNWWEPEGNSLVTLWRTTPFMIDLPLDEDGDGKAKGDGLMDLVIMDSEGYLSFFQRYKDEYGNLKLKEGQRIFKSGDSNTTLGFNVTLKEGQSGKVNYILTDFDKDGKVDLIRNYSLNFRFYRNIATKQGEYIFDASGIQLHTRNLQDHTPCPAICDWNQDDVPDLLAGSMDGCFYYLTNKIYDPDAVPGVVEPENPEDYLTAYWDFEGTESEVYGDKATAGSTADTLSVINDSVSIADGVATITGAGALEAVHSTDVNPEKAMTIVFKARVSGADVGNISLVDKRFGTDGGRTYSVGIMSAQDSSTGAVTGTAARAEMKNSAGWLCSTDTNAAALVQPYAKGEWKEYALVVAPNGSGGLIGTLYASVGEYAKAESDWVQLGTMSAKNSEELETYALTTLRIGNDGEGRNSAYIREFEEVRIYSAALSLAQISELNLGDPETTPEEELKEFAGYTYVTPKDFGFEDKDYTVITNASKRPESVDKLMFQATVTMKNDNVSGVMYMMKQGSTTGDYSLRLYGKNDFGFYLVNMFGSEMGVEVYDGATGQKISYADKLALKCSVAFPDGSVTYQNIVGSTFKLGFTSEYVDYDSDGEQDDIKLGIWFNGLLYNNQYFYLTNCKNGTNTVVPNFKVNLGTGGTTSIASVAGCQMEVQPEITDSIAMKYKATVDPMLLKIAEPSMKIETGEGEVTNIKGTPVEKGSNIYTFAYPGLMPQDMAQDIKASIAVGTNSKEYTHSMLGYCSEILNTQWPAEGTVLGCATPAQLADLKDLVVDLVEYGASVQTYRKVAESELLTAKLASVVSNYKTFDQTDDDASALASLSGVSSKLTQDSGVAETTAYKWKNVSLVLGNKIKIRARFTADNVTNLKVKVAIAGEEKEIAYKKDTQAGVYVLDFDGIYAYENGTPITLKFYTGSVQVGKTLHYSVNTYLNEMRESTVENLPALLLAIHNYGNAALDYKNNYASAAK